MVNGKFNVVCPVVNVNLALDMLDSIKQNIVHPSKIIIIDNSETGFDYKTTVKGLNVWIYSNFEKKLGVNESWIRGASIVDPDCEYISFLNDDILLKKYFFEKLDRAFQTFKDFGVICPATVNDLDKFNRLSAFSERFVHMKKREGWSFTIRRKLYDKIPLIPFDRFSTFCGDDWLWFWTYRLNYIWAKDVSNIIYHKVGASMQIKPEIRETLGREKQAYRDYIESLQL